MARRRRPEVPPLDDTVPAWLWQFRFADWGLPGVPSAEEPAAVAAIVAARRKWQRARHEWLTSRGLVVWSMSGLSWGEFRRIEREEPHRVLRPPPRAS
ncbi:hypothetical protein ACG5V6_14955 [Streptomyces chitinivorans]|uniref:Uncharacterized protein n=1 Tax=Streptomyces chitinivorans TaxID=1257027 RepID=A0ABW7HUT5_9ACTN|nr:hypothetical protein [Streptomyces chitinivorans]MDH2407185.1 hypothetical protein [Streptomyces chitinivorans]